MASITVSDGSLGDQGSCSTGGSKPKKSLDELLSSTRKNSGDFADMPRLESFRADDMSAVTSASFTSNSRAGDSRASVGDDNASLPSLSSFRMEDLSTCSSYHSLQTANQHSDQSGDAWASFRSGNVSIDTHAESDDGRRRMKLGLVRVSSAPTKAATRNNSGDSTSGTSLASPPLQSSNGYKQNTAEHLVHHEKESEEDNTARKDHDSVPAIERSTQQTTSSPVDPTSHSVITPKNPSKRADHTTSIHKEGYRDLERRSGVQRTKSLDLDALQPMRVQKNAFASMSLSMGGFSDGSSSTLKGGDSLPKIPRRSSTIQDHDEEADDASKVSDDCTRISSDGDVTNISDNSEVSIGSDVDSDLSIETDADGQRQTKVPNRNINDLSTATELTQHCRTESDPLTHQDEGTRQKPDYTLINSTDDKGRQTMNDASKTQIQFHQEATKTLPNAGRPNEFGSENETIIEEHGGLGTHAKHTKATRVTSSPPKEQNSDTKRGKLLRRLSSSLKNIGRSASFRNSFRRKGKQNSLSNDYQPSIGMAAQAMAASPQADGTIKN